VLVDVVLSPQLAGNKQLREQVIVVLDILRATSTIVTALGNQALQVIPVVEPGEAFEWKKKIGTDRCLIGGERQGYKIDGFNLGNSPGEYLGTIVAGKVIILCTSNGTKAINWAKEAREVVIGSFLNMATVVEYLRMNGRYDITVICSGREGDLSLEDLAGAGMIVDALSDYALTDTAKIARYTYEKAKDTGITAFVGQTEHGQYLQKIGMETDIACCTALNKFPILPIFKDEVIRIY
jgi:2-phosphosulfolactate phosphatase